MSDSPATLSFDLPGIMTCQQNRHPVLLIDRIVEAVPGQYAKGIKNFTYNEWFFPGHFADDPNVPGFIQVECLVQTFIMTFLCMDEYKGLKTNFASINNVRFKHKIIPGDRLEITATLESLRHGLAKGRAESFVDGNPACSAEFLVTIPDVFARLRPVAR